MSYFSRFPNVYVAEGVTTDQSYRYRLVKNIFRRVEIREGLAKYTNNWERAQIPEGLKPCDVAQSLFDDPFMDWVILLVNNITDVYEQWPKTEIELQEYVRGKYADPDSVHHYETQEALYNETVIVKEGIEVNSTWRTVLPDGTILGESQSIYPVSNYEHETFINEQKRFINIPTAGVVNKILDEFSELIAYLPHAELDDQGNKKTPLSIASRFTNQAGSIAAQTSTLRTYHWLRLVSHSSLTTTYSNTAWSWRLPAVRTSSLSLTST